MALYRLGAYMDEKTAEYKESLEDTMIFVKVFAIKSVWPLLIFVG